MDLGLQPRVLEINMIVLVFSCQYRKDLLYGFQGKPRGFELLLILKNWSLRLDYRHTGMILGRLCFL